MLHLTKSQAEVALDRHRFRVLCCGRRWGKTTLAMDQMKGRAAIPNSRIAYVAPTYQQARDIAWEQLSNDCRQAAETINETRLEIKLVNGSQIFLRGWESIETLRGQKFDLIVLDEIAMMRNFWSHWQEIIRPTLTDTKGEGIFISTPKGFNHFYDLFNLQNEDTDYKSFHFTTYDNDHIPKDEVDKAQKELTEDRFAQEYLADFRKVQGLVYKEFDREKHLFDEPGFEGEDFVCVKKFGGVDFGFTNPAAVYTIKKDKDANYWITDEWYQTGKTDAQIADYVSALKWNECYPDPESAGGIAELERRKVNVREVLKNKDSVRNGINVVRELFKSNRLYVSNSCKNLIWELETYSYPDKKPEHNEEEKPIKENDHACFPAGTIVNGYDISEVGVQTGVEDVYEYSIGNEKIRATTNHPVLTHRGLVNIDALRYDDVIWTNKSSFMLVSGGQDMSAVLRGLKGITTKAAQRIVEARGRDYIVSYGKKKTELSLMDTTFITLMATPTIIQWTILSVFSALNTLKTIGQKKSANGLERISRMLLQWLLNGQRLQWVGSYGQRWGNETLTLCTTDQPSNGTAIYAEKNTQQKETGRIDSVIVTAVKKHFVGRVPVYNLKTKSGMYLANNLVVSNCDAIRYALSMEQIAKPIGVTVRHPTYTGFNRRG